MVGASIAGCTAATMFARRGLNVALIEKREDAKDYKKLCTHFIQASATPTIQRLGIASAIEEAGGVRNGFEVWTRWGWIRPDTDTYGYSIRRQKLDPMLRNLAVNTSGINFLLGSGVRELIFANNRVTGIRVGSQEVTARLVVGADGHHSNVAQLSGIPAIVKPNNRFFLLAYFRNLYLKSGMKAQVWLLDPDFTFMSPNEDGLTVVAVGLTKDKLPAFKGDLQKNYVQFLEALPEGPSFKEAEQVSELRGMFEIPNISRTATMPGLALIGDAALGSDPYWAVGCGWAFQSAEWLVDSLADAILTMRDVEVDRALECYRKKHKSELASHHSQISGTSTSRRFNLIEKLLFSAAVRDPVTARKLEAFFGRRIKPRQFLTLRTLGRILWINMTRREPTVRGKSCLLRYRAAD